MLQTFDPCMLQSRFHKAMELVGSEFVAKVQHYCTAWLPARDIVDQALLSRFDVRVSMVGLFPH